MNVVHQCSKRPLQLELKLARVDNDSDDGGGGGGEDFNAAKAVLNSIAKNLKPPRATSIERKQATEKGTKTSHDKKHGTWLLIGPAIRLA